MKILRNSYFFAPSIQRESIKNTLLWFVKERSNPMEKVAVKALMWITIVGLTLSLVGIPLVVKGLNLWAELVRKPSLQTIPVILPPSAEEIERRCAQILGQTSLNFTEIQTLPIRVQLTLMTYPDQAVELLMHTPISDLQELDIDLLCLLLEHGKGISKLLIRHVFTLEQIQNIEPRPWRELVVRHCMELNCLMTVGIHFEDIQNITGNQEEIRIISSEMRQDLVSQVIRRIESAIN